MRWYEWLAARCPERVIPDRSDTTLPYLSRYYLIGSQHSKWFAVVLHRFHRGDSDDYRHDHPWWCWLSIVLAGGYWEDTVKGWFFRRAGDIQFHRGSHKHRVHLDAHAGPVWTLFVMGPRYRGSKWFFHAPSGPIEHDDYLRGKRA